MVLPESLLGYYETRGYLPVRENKEGKDKPTLEVGSILATDWTLAGDNMVIRLYCHPENYTRFSYT